MSYALPLATQRRSQAIPMAVYRRQVLLAQGAPRVALLVLAAILYGLAASPWQLGTEIGVPSSESRLRRADVGVPVTLPDRPALADTRPALAPPPRAVARGVASLSGASSAVLTNVQIAISFLDGVVIEPGEQLSFDDTARTWDFKEDPRYIAGPATALRGPIVMRGGGVCWLSSALWRAALEAGLRTDLRENHYGLIESLGPGLDASNTLVIRNDSAAPLTVRASMDDEQVSVTFLADQPLDRIASIRGPERLGPRTYAVYQDVFWADGRTTTSEFVSRYFW